jgi:formamidopyrimidine-DNA glycosylase
MPELPEVENVRLQLLAKIVGKTITKVEVFNAKSAGSEPDFAQKLIGKKFAHIDRVGKLMIFSFTKEDNLFLLGHLKMTGQFFFVDKKGLTGGGHTMSKSDGLDLPNKHTRLAFYLSDGSALFFNDMRKFGYVKIATKIETEAARARFGEEPIATTFDYKTFFTKLQKRNTPIKAALLDQTFVAGLGNIYVDEALFAAKVRPDRMASSLTRAEATAVIRAGGKIMNHSISVGGTTFQSFADTNGHAGNFTEHLRVFGKQKTLCPRCKKGDIQKIRVAGRGTHFCPSCQK